MALHGYKWDGFDCDLLGVVLPPPFSKHLLKSPVYFVGSFGDYMDAMNELTQLSSPPSVVVKPLFPVNTYQLDELSGDALRGWSPEYYNLNETEFEDVIEAELMSCADEEEVCNSSEDEDDEEGEVRAEAPFILLEFE
jgi:hypothetical protein